MSDHHAVLVLGGGSAGVSVAARLRRADARLDIGLVEPAESHFYQPLWTLVGAGVFPREASRRPEADFIPPRVDWSRDRIVGLRPAAHEAVLAKVDTHERTTLTCDMVHVRPPMSAGRQQGEPAGRRDGLVYRPPGTFAPTRGIRVASGGAARALRAGVCRRAKAGCHPRASGDGAGQTRPAHDMAEGA